jgi:glycosyltransferase involved in cell wall biosynthesis
MSERPASAVSTAGRATVAIVMKCWPRLTETFIAQEMAGLEACGVPIEIWSLRHPTDAVTHPVHARVKATVKYLPEYLEEDRARVRRASAKVRHLPGYRLAWQRFVKDLARDRTANRVRRFGQALVLAAELPDGIERLYAHFLHTPASVTRYAALIRGLPWSVSAHAKDIWTSEDWDISEKLAECDWLATCTDAGLQRLRSLTRHPDRLMLVYHGLDFAHLPPPPAHSGPGAHSRRDGSDAGDPVVILSIGRKVEKKGYDDLLEALARLPKDLHWRFEHIGGGALGDALVRQAERLGIADRCRWLGARSQPEVFAAYARADLFVLAAKKASDGDQDGLPNVLMEAAHQGLALVSTHAAAIGEFVTDGDNGLLVDPAAPDQLSRALATMARDPDLRRRLAARAADLVRTRFSYRAGVERLAERLGYPRPLEASDPEARPPEARPVVARAAE